MTPTGIEAVMLRDTPNVSPISDKPREWLLVPEALRDVFWQLCDGRLPWPLFLHGNAGGGKTCAALAMCDMGYRRKYATLADACDELRSAQRGEHRWGYTEREFWLSWGKPGLRVIDEVGVRREPKDFETDTLKRLLDLRNGWSLIVCSNWPLSRLREIYDERIASRLRGGTRYEFAGEDLRKAQGVKA